MPTAFPILPARTLAVSLLTLRRRYRKRLNRCQRRFSDAAVHDLRIETRRLLALLDLLRSLQFERAVRKPRKVLKRRLDAFDGLRDTHVCLALLKPLRREFPEARPLDALWRRRERELVAQLGREIKTTKPARLQKRLKDVEKTARARGDSERWSSHAQLAQTALREAYARVLALRRRIRRNAPATVHRTRVAFKRFRYLTELLEPLLPGLTQEHREQMRGFQSRMGDIQDLQVLLAAVTAAVKEAGFPPADGRRLRAALLRRRREMIDHFLTSLDGLSNFNPSSLGLSGVPAELTSPPP